MTKSIAKSVNIDLLLVSPMWIHTNIISQTCIRSPKSFFKVILKIATEFRNVGDVAYDMSHAAAETCSQRLAAGRGHGYRLAAPSLQPEGSTGSGSAC